MLSDTSHRDAAPAALGLFSLVVCLHLFRYHPGLAMKDLFYIIFPLSIEILHHIGWFKALKNVLTPFAGGVGCALLAWVSVVAYVQRNLILWPEEDSEIERTLLGRPLLFPARLTHSRMFPEKYNYWINYFLVGIPVGLRGRVGSVISIDSGEPGPSSPPKSSLRSFVNMMFGKLLWFTVDTDLYLHRGDGHLGLGEDPRQYPYAYIVSIPRFLWWTKSPISYWYLYSPSKELSAIIMEINNSFGEKKNAFTRLTPEDSSSFEKAKSCEVISTASGTGPNGTQSVRFMSSAPTAKYYKGSWKKDIFASPFEKVEGSFALRFVDPLDPAPDKGGPLHTNMTLITSSGKPKITSRLFSTAPPLDPLLAPSWEVLIFLLRWSFTIPISLGRIVVEALRIRFRGNLPYLNKPEVKRNNIPRNASEAESALEPVFQLYLSHLVDACSFPLTMIYIPAKSLHLHPVSMRSPIKTPTSAPRPTLTIQPLTPQFYTNILKYTDASLGFTTEIEHLPQVCDPVSQRLWTSDAALLQKLIACAGTFPTSEEARSVFPWRRESAPKTFMDIFTESNLSVGMCRRYRAAKMHCYLTENLAWGSYKVAAVYTFFLRLALMWIIPKGLGWMLYGTTAVVKPEHFLVVSSIIFLGVRMWATLSDWIYS
ncbi:hypothetical protein N7537_003419 [Penicillium hordei]|uniref:Uncharacterized protein n=1 Tax=Penicillium hordei TaxID=40994 RepID=A0AAD6E998_9EURO|nr:uncharacterized protein N7537_003419 [Penicillium hordei]KAJ5606800.1 hypothetical protein N7537_003419 [Penicillium hordei]